MIALFLYLTLYTWNLRTGTLDRLASNTGLTFVGLVLKPGDWVFNSVADLWARYVHLVNVQRENERLAAEVKRLTMEAARSRESLEELSRLRQLLTFQPPPEWRLEGARVLSRRVGPYALLETLIVDKGENAGVTLHLPAVTHAGVVGRVFRVSPFVSQVLLLTDPNSRIAVLGQSSRTSGILIGQGGREPLSLEYAPLNAPLEEGEILITSGFAGIFPKGLPVARVASVERSDISLFQRVTAEPLVAPHRLEEVLLLKAATEPDIPLALRGNASAEVLLNVDVLVDQLLARNATARPSLAPPGELADPAANATAPATETPAPTP